jgi:hypothetical protein
LAKWLIAADDVTITQKVMGSTSALACFFILFLFYILLMITSRLHEPQGYNIMEAYEKFKIIHEIQLMGSVIFRMNI